MNVGRIADFIFLLDNFFVTSELGGDGSRGFKLVFTKVMLVAFIQNVPSVGRPYLWYD